MRFCSFRIGFFFFFFLPCEEKIQTILDSNSLYATRAHVVDIKVVCSEGLPEVDVH
jgi:hypothetical protein